MPTPAEIKKNGGEVVGTTGIPLGTADMTPFLSKISGDFDGLFGIFFGKDGITIGNQAFDLGLTKKYKWAGDGAIAKSTNLPALGSKINGFIGINRYIPVFQGPFDQPHHRKFFDEAVVRLKKMDPSGPLPGGLAAALLGEPGDDLLVGLAVALAVEAAGAGHRAVAGVGQALLVAGGLGVAALDHPPDRQVEGFGRIRSRGCRGRAPP